MRFKKILIIILVFVIIGALLFLFFYFLQSRKYKIKPKVASEDSFSQYLKIDPLAKELFSEKPKIFDIDQPKTVKKIKDKKIYFPEIFNQSIYYLSEEGKLYKESIFSEEKINLLPLNVINPENVQMVKWNLPNYVIIFSLDVLRDLPEESIDEPWQDAAVIKVLYNLETKSTVNLDKNIKDIIWEKDSGQIYYYFTYNEAEKNNLIFKADNKEKKVEKIAEILGEEILLPEKKQKTKNKLYFLQYSESENKILVLELDLKTSQPQILFKLENISTLNFSENGSYFLGNNQLNKRFNTFIFDLETKQFNNLEKAFLVDKVVWNDNIAYFVLGENVNFGRADAPDYAGSYIFLKFDVEKNEFVQLTNLAKNKKDIIDPLDIEISGDKIYFTNLRDQALYELDLK